MCEYCESGNCYGNKNMTEHKNSEISICKDELEIQYDEAFGWTSMYYNDCIKIKFCPFCGRKLSEDNE